MSITNEIQKTENIIRETYEGLETLGAEMPEKKNLSNLLGTVETPPKGGEEVLNGVIEKYLAENETIDAGTFVEFVSGLKNSLKLDSNSAVSGTGLDALYLGDSKAIVSWGGVFKKNYSACVCDFSGETITKGTSVILENNSTATWNSSGSIEIFKMGESFVALYLHHGNTDASSRTIGYTIFSVKDKTITVKNSDWLYGTEDGAFKASYVQLDDSRIFCVNTGALSSGSLTSTKQVFTFVLSGDYLNKTTSVSLTTKYYQGIFATKIGKDRVLVVNSHKPSSLGTSSVTLSGFVCSIDGSVVSTQSEITLKENFENSASGAGNSLVQTKEDEALLVYYVYNNFPKALLFQVSENDISVASEVVLEELGIVATGITAIATREDLVTVFARRGDSTIPIAQLKIEAGNIEILSVQLITVEGSIGEFLTAKALGDTTFMLMYSVSSNPYFQVYSKNHATVVKPATRLIQGLAATTCTPDQEGEVWVLNKE